LDLYSFVNGPLIWVAFSVFIVGVLTRLAFFFSSVLRDPEGKEKGWAYYLSNIGRSLLPFHRAALKMPVYAGLRYVFHICLFAVPIWLSGHIVLWSESRLEWDWTALPDAWADGMTILVVALALFFLLRRVIVSNVRSGSSVSDFLLIVITALPFVSGYFLTHGTLDSLAFFEEHIMLIHILSGEIMILTAVFLFCRTRLNTEKCVACTACEMNCPTGTLESEDKENKRIFTYSHYQCICCGACVKTCPETAAELRHEISLNRLLQVGPKQEIRSVDLTACERCGAFFVPEPQLNKIGKMFAHDYTRFCPRCRKVNIGEVYHKLSPWTKTRRFNRSGKAEL
jgi:Pyruvate/2-oxoacid:ferredoxin oxidoreductase delta subunit